MKTFFYLLLIILALIGCQKDSENIEVKKPLSEIIIENHSGYPVIESIEDEVKFSKASRNGSLYWVFDLQRYGFTNFLMASLPKYVNEQILLNKDSIAYILLNKLPEPQVTIGQILHEVYEITIVTTGDTIPANILPIKVFALAGLPSVIYPSGTNYAPLTNKFIRWKRTNRKMVYYDWFYRKPKEKFSYEVTSILQYSNDWVNGNHQNSNIYNILSI